MPIEIHRPELEVLILQCMKWGGFENVEDALMQALEVSPVIDDQEHESLGRKSNDTRTGADLIQALQSSPNRELEIEPARFCSPMPARDVTF